MAKHLTLLLAAFMLFSCGKDKKNNDEEVLNEEKPALVFSTKNYYKKTSLPCDEYCPSVTINVPEAENVPVVADSINNKIFNTVRGIVYLGETPYEADNYEDLMASFLGSYEELKKEFPNDPMAGFEAKIDASVDYTSDEIINVKMNHYTFTGGAHGYGGERSLLFDSETGKSLSYEDIFTNVDSFRQFAEGKFREKFNIPAGKSINATGFLFENDKFVLPQNIFFKENGLLLFYNSYEISSYAEGQKELLLPYSEVNEYLKVK
ncbi:DUF3298 and DUF4163 domain-containing protein [Flavobacterium sp. C4GT6]|uniref:DUF3298 and DUF4163 domain-containing protein n=1 Tax=Flavobacterium sp. C4GT6 TaxID=3103818 RepID=UPI002ED438D3